MKYKDNREKNKRNVFFFFKLRKEKRKVKKKVKIESRKGTQKEEGK